MMLEGSRILVRLFIVSPVACASLLLFADRALADTATTSPYNIAFYCPPYTTSFEKGGYYQFATTSQFCVWQTGDLPSSVPHYGGLFRGVVGNSTGGGGSMGLAPSKEMGSGSIVNPQQGEPFFAAIWEQRTGPAFSGDTAAFLQFFTNGSSPPPAGAAWGVINWKWGVPTVDATVTTPVIIIPGILGSAPHNGQWLIDPITHVYDNLIDTLAANGYEKDKTLFTFPYDWHLSNVTTATLLKNKIDEVKGICGCDQVDIVAHSMGGLIARQYIQSPDYAHDVRKLIFLGTPQMGAPEAYLMWEGGKSDIDIVSKILQSILTFEALKNGYSNLFDYERQFPIPSVQELLPVYGYIRHVGSYDIPSFPNSQWYPGNLFLYNLDNNISALYNSGVTISNFIGQTSENKTITTIRVVSPLVISTSALWGFGTPENFGNTSTDQGLERGAGDGTVPLASANLVINDLDIVDSEHNDLPTTAEGQVFEKLTGKDATTLVNNGHGFLETAKNVLIFEILSPADIVVVAPDGKKVGKDFATGQEVNQIAGAFYSGFGTDNEFVTIPNPEDGQYKVITQGTGNGGEYTIATGVIGDATSSDAFFAGTTLPNLITEHDVSVNPDVPDATTIVPADQTPPTITFIQPATTTYSHSDMVPINVVFDDATGVATSSVSLDATPVAASSTTDLFFQSLGNHTITASSTDLVNNATTSKKNILVIATASSTQSDVNRVYTLGWTTSKDLKNLLFNQLNQVIKMQKVTSILPISGNPKKTQTITTLVRVVDTILLKTILAELQLAKVLRQINSQGYQTLMSDINWLINH